MGHWWWWWWWWWWWTSRKHPPAVTVWEHRASMSQTESTSPRLAAGLRTQQLDPGCCAGDRSVLLGRLVSPGRCRQGTYRVCGSDWVGVGSIWMPGAEGFPAEHYNNLLTCPGNVSADQCVCWLEADGGSRSRCAGVCGDQVIRGRKSPGTEDHSISGMITAVWQSPSKHI